MGRGQIVIYNTEDNLAKINLHIFDGTVWLNQAELALLFETTKANISLHTKNIFADDELDEKVVVKEYLTTTQHGAMVGKTQSKNVKYYNVIELKKIKEALTMIRIRYPC